jgi:hypothetical protein
MQWSFLLEEITRMMTTTIRTNPFVKKTAEKKGMFL